ncbi:MAG: hypothetical protein JWM05_1878, partial [Acidimicrobiales bacterium]|nr:hypothetical protein [Acidimicrobiales bacterium]
MRRSVALPITAIAVTIGLLSPQLASASRSGDPRTELEKVRAQQANVASGVNASKATLAEIDQALQALDNNVSSQQRLLSDANQAEAEATREADAADAAVQRITKEQAKLHKAVAARAVAAYMNPPADDLLTMLQTKDITMANDRKLFVELRATRDSDLADQLRGLGRDLDYQRGRAKSAKELATRKRDEQRQRTLKVERAQAAKKKLADGIQARIDSQVAVSIKLARTNKALSTQIALQQAQLAARLAAERAVAAAAQAAANRRPPASTFRPTGGESRPLPPVSVPP